MLPIDLFGKQAAIFYYYRLESLKIKLSKEVGDMKGVKGSISVFSVIVIALVLSGVGFVTAAFAHDVEVEVEEVIVVEDLCTSQGDIPCTQICGPAEIHDFKAGGVQYTEMTQSRQLNLLSGQSVDFMAPCPPGSHAVSGGYAFLPEGTTIDMDEIRMTSQRTNIDDASKQESWIVSIYREQSGAPDNCINVEVRALCVR